MGYNKGWKIETKMGTKNNKRFYEIPYRKILNKLRSKMEEKGKTLIEQEEAYTSRCDSLVLESVEKHITCQGEDDYKGTRKGRLYKSSTGKIINADLNGAINIMMKYCKRSKIAFTKVIGEKLHNPIKIKNLNQHTML